MGSIGIGQQNSIETLTRLTRMKVINSHTNSRSSIPIKTSGGLAGYQGNFGYGNREENNYMKQGSSYDQVTSGQIKSHK